MTSFRAAKELLAILIAGMFSLVTVAAALETADEHGSCPEWSYSGANGPEHWGDLCPEFAACKTGKEQSPIDITNPQVVQLSAIHFANHPVPLKIIDNGHTIQQKFAPGNGNTITVSKLLLNGVTVVDDLKRNGM